MNDQEQTKNSSANAGNASNTSIIDKGDKVKPKTAEAAVVFNSMD